MSGGGGGEASYRIIVRKSKRVSNTHHEINARNIRTNDMASRTGHLFVQTIINNTLGKKQESWARLDFLLEHGLFVMCTLKSV